MWNIIKEKVNWNWKIKLKKEKKRETTFLSLPCSKSVAMTLKNSSFFFFLKIFIYLFLERGGWKEKERERNFIVWLPLARPPLGDLGHNPGMCPDWELNQRLFGSQAHTQSTELYQPRQLLSFLSLLSPSLHLLIFPNNALDKLHITIRASLSQRQNIDPHQVF